MGGSRIEMRVEVYIKPSCSLCDEAKELLSLTRERWAFDLIEHDIYERAEWFERYRYDIPVVVIDGVDRLKLRFGEQELEAALQTASVETS